MDNLGARSALFLLVLRHKLWQRNLSWFFRNSNRPAHRWRNDRRRVFRSGAQRFRQCNHALWIGGDTFPCFKELNPLREHLLRLIEKTDQSRIDFQLKPQPKVESLFDSPSGFTQILEPDHPPTSLERME